MTMIQSSGNPERDLGLDRPNVARMYDYFLGGGHHFSLDREAADAVLAVAPEVASAARANRRFLHRAVRYALACGIRQFVDLGSGIPTVGNVHDIAHRCDPSARVIYVDCDSIAVTHAEALLTDVPTVGVVEADLRDTETVLGHAETRRLIDFTEPVAVLLVSVLHFVPGDVAPVVAAYRAAMSPGSLLVISHASPAPATGQTDEVQHLYEDTPTPLWLRTSDEIRVLFTGLDLVAAHSDFDCQASGDEPDGGLVPVAAWRPDDDPPRNEIEDSPFLDRFLVGVGRKPRPPARRSAEATYRTQRLPAHNSRRHSTSKQMPNRADVLPPVLAGTSR